MNAQPEPLRRPLTDRQRSIYDFICGEIESRGRPPTLREIGSQFGIGSTNGVRAALITLEQKGWLKRDPFSSRGITISKRRPANASVVRIPIVGRVAAGAPLLAEENIDGEILIDRGLFPAGDGFALRVKGSSMINAGISDGDIVLARPDLPLERGSIVVALIGEEATVKRFYPERNQIRLEAANEAFSPIIVASNTPGFHIVGRVVGLYRRY